MSFVLDFHVISNDISASIISEKRLVGKKMIPVNLRNGLVAQHLLHLVVTGIKQLVMMQVRMLPPQSHKQKLENQPS